MAMLPGTTVLETLRANGIPHASVCGGRARCTTCRVRVVSGQARGPMNTANIRLCIPVWKRIFVATPVIAYLVWLARQPLAPFVQGANGLDYLYKSDTENDKLVWQRALKVAVS